MIFLQIYFLTSQGSTKIPFINNNKVYGSDELQSLWLKVLTPIIMGTTEAAWVGGGVAIVSDDKHRPPRAHPAIQESALIKQQRVKLI